MKRMRRILVVGLCFLSSLTGAFAQEVLLGTTGGVGTTLYRINPNTGGATAVGALVDSSGHFYSVTGLAFDNVTGILYGSTSNRSATASNSLVAINPLTGRVTFIGSFVTSNGTMADLTFDTTTATLYGTGSVDGNLYSINMATGAATAVGSAGFPPNSTSGLGVAANSAGQIFGAPTGASGPLVQYNKTDGSVTTVATLSGAPFSSGAIGAMAFNSGGTLYGLNQSTSGSRPVDLVTIDTVTGVVTDIGATASLMDAIVFITPVPEPTTIGMMFLGSGCLAALTALRRRRRDLPDNHDSPPLP
jgi:hypothetical protein